MPKYFDFWKHIFVNFCKADDHIETIDFDIVAKIKIQETAILMNRY